MSEAVLGAKECAILGAVSAAPIHGYELVRLLRDRGYEEWTELSLPTVYRIIATLERAGYLRSRAQGSARGAPRRCYTITAAGRKALRVSLVGHLREPTRTRSSFDLAIAHIDEVGATTARGAIEVRLQTLEARHATMTGRREAQRPLPWNVEALFLHGELLYQAEKAYLEHILRTLPGPMR